MDEIRLTDRAFLRETMQRFGIVTKKKYGQNFLINEADSPAHRPGRVSESLRRGA